MAFPGAVSSQVHACNLQADTSKDADTSVEPLGAPSEAQSAPAALHCIAQQGAPSIPIQSQAPAAIASTAEQDKGDRKHQDDEKTEGCDNEDGAMESFFQKLASLAIGASPKSKKAESKQKLLDSFDLEGVAKLVQGGKVKNIICMCGAGISVSAGIPDFRTPGTGLYSQLAKFGLPRPEAVFSLDYFRFKPEPFHRLARELYPGQHKPTPTHYFMTLLQKKGLLLRCFTQNIDSLECIAGLPKDRVVAAHGNFDSASCIDCGLGHNIEWVKKTILAGEICRCQSLECGGLVKPDIVFFGESLPDAFEKCSRNDTPKCDLLIVMGTSLVVHPFAGLLNEVTQHCPRLLINREAVGLGHEREWVKPGKSGGFLFHRKDNYRDVHFLGDCDEGVRKLCDLLGWQSELEEVITSGHEQLDAANGSSEAPQVSCGCSER